jgi:hypothetical protein
MGGGSPVASGETLRFGPRALFAQDAQPPDPERDADHEGHVGEPPHHDVSDLPWRTWLGLLRTRRASR